MDMDSPNELQNKLDVIALRYLERTQGELVQLRAHIERACLGDAAAFAAVEVLAHKIHGSGAMLGFTQLGGFAGQLEELMVKYRRAAATAPQTLNNELLMLLSNIEAALAEARKQRSLPTS
jgi:chemotaxis protein histidine kinase CheA